MPIFHAIAAMSENRVIGNQGKIPWHLPEDFRWFKHKTMGGTLIMGRKTFESIGKPLAGRDTLVLTRRPLEQLSDTAFLPQGDFDSYVNRHPTLCYWVCGGAQIYKQMLKCCDVLYLTRVSGEVEGDTNMPTFEDQFTPDQVIRETDKFRVERWRKNNRPPLPAEQWPDFSERKSDPSSVTLQPPKVTYCLYHPDDRPSA